MSTPTVTARKLTMARAISEAIGQEMARDPQVLVWGEDVGVYGGIFGATQGLHQQFGSERVIDTPISESAFIGAAIGASAEGLRPVVELMFVDFFGVAMDQIYNQLAKNHYMSGGSVRHPMVLMTAIGGGYSDAAQHSQTLYSIFAHVPGLKVVVPSNAYDAKGLMATAIRDDNPSCISSIRACWAWDGCLPTIGQKCMFLKKATKSLWAKPILCKAART